MDRHTNSLLLCVIIILILDSLTDTFFSQRDIAKGVEAGILKAAEQLDCKGAPLETANLRPRQSW